MNKIVKQAFTLIELLVVISIIGILSTFVVVQMNSATNATKDTKRKADIQLLANAVVSYSSENYSNKPTQTTPCTIGGDCPTTISDSLEPFLATLPTDPNSGAYYTYQSDGSDCTISATLSNGTVYQYSCNTKLTTTGTSTSGVCGSANNSNSYTQPTSNFCSDGSTPTVSVSATGWTWSCPGTYLGDSTSCIANKSVDVVCGSAATNSYTQPTSNFCSDGSTPTVSGTGPWTWSCPGLNGGTSSGTCTANKSINGVCTAGLTFYTKPSSGSCTAGAATSVTGTGPWYWGCSGINSGTSTSSTACSALKKVDGVCGSANNTILSTAPSTNFCATGTATVVSGSGPWSWTCEGSYFGTTASCSANLGLVNNVHTAKNCTDANGTVVDSDVAQKQCKFVSASCPSNWNQYKNYSTTIPSSLNDSPAPPVSCGGQSCGGCPAGGGYSGSHTWNNAAPEVIVTVSRVLYGYWENPKQCQCVNAYQYPYWSYCFSDIEIHFGTEYYGAAYGTPKYAVITSIGCY